MSAKLHGNKMRVLAVLSLAVLALVPYLFIGGSSNFLDFTISSNELMSLKKNFGDAQTRWKEALENKEKIEVRLRRANEELRTANEELVKLRPHTPVSIASLNSKVIEPAMIAADAKLQAVLKPYLASDGAVNDAGINDIKTLPDALRSVLEEHLKDGFGANSCVLSSYLSNNVTCPGSTEQDIMIDFLLALTMFQKRVRDDTVSLLNTAEKMKSGELFASWVESNTCMKAFTKGAMDCKTVYMTVAQYQPEQVAGLFKQWQDHSVQSTCALILARDVSIATQILEQTGGYGTVCNLTPELQRLEFCGGDGETFMQRDTGGSMKVKGLLDLTKAGLNVVYSDADTYWKRLLTQDDFPSSDIAISSYESDTPNDLVPGSGFEDILNFGFVVARPGDRSTTFLNRVWLRMNTWWEFFTWPTFVRTSGLLEPSRYICNDQNALRDVFRKHSGISKVMSNRVTGSSVFKSIELASTGITLEIVDPTYVLLGYQALRLPTDSVAIIHLSGIPNKKHYSQMIGMSMDGTPCGEALQLASQDMSLDNSKEILSLGLHLARRLKRSFVLPWCPCPTAVKRNPPCVCDVLVNTHLLQSLLGVALLDPLYHERECNGVAVEQCKVVGLSPLAWAEGCIISNTSILNIAMSHSNDLKVSVDSDIVQVLQDQWLKV